MSLFSQRKGLKPIKNVIQIDSMDADLRNGLWNVLSVHYWSDIQEFSYMKGTGPMYTLSLALWHNYFKWPLDTMGEQWYEVRTELRRYFFACEWYEAYDFVEFIANTYPNKVRSQQFMEACNLVLERELSGLRFVSGHIAEITGEEEITEIEEALQASSSLKPVADHLKRSLVLLTDRNSPDYRNSIKESISAVEALCNLIAGSSPATLGQALKALEKTKTVDMHPALRSAFEKLYGYTSNADGIRHALLQESDLSFEDAKFMLVSSLLLRII